jgi:hypothetical protein
VDTHASKQDISKKAQWVTHLPATMTKAVAGWCYLGFTTGNSNSPVGDEFFYVFFCTFGMKMYD